MRSTAQSEGRSCYTRKGPPVNHPHCTKEPTSDQQGHCTKATRSSLHKISHQELTVQKMDQPTSMLRFVAMASLVWTSILRFVANTSLTWTNMLRLIDKIHHWQKLLCSDNKKNHDIITNAPC